ncbi:MAG TPA: aspartate aminotransferase family protein [Steroidobacteraceae bacterium]|nr:aspartate aminotransferase family protein [Steroidobacteraceae bacterium]
MPVKNTEIARSALQAMLARERQRFEREHPLSARAHATASAHWLHGVPMHWMHDWGTPFPIAVREAEGAQLIDVDSRRYSDFCLGDTGAMFGHSPYAVTRAIVEQAQRGLTCMLPSEDAGAVGVALARIFRLPYWQVTQTASDANRCVLRWARGITGRRFVVVFDGCYHGMVDDSCVKLEGGRTVAKPSLIGQVYDLASATRVVAFNDLAGLEQALKTRDVACVLCEPALTNVGMVLPDPGFHVALRELTRKHGALLAIDETHTLSTGLGGYSRVCGLEPDFLVVGKAVAGGFPCAVYGFNAELRERMLGVLATKPEGHSGMGTTLAANRVAMAALNACLGEVMTPDSYAHMIEHAVLLEEGLEEVFRPEGWPFSITRVGARLELLFRAVPPRNAVEARVGLDDELSLSLRLYLANRGVLITPFHNMMLVSPATTRVDLEALRGAFADWLRDLKPLMHPA